MSASLRQDVTIHAISRFFDGEGPRPLVQASLRGPIAKGAAAATAKPTTMADAPQNSVTRDDLRDALAHSAPRRRPTGLLSEPRESGARREPREFEAPREREPVSSEPAWDWDAAPSAAD